MNYHRENRTGGNSGKKYARRGSGEQSFATMHRAICSECNKECEVPFKPSGEKSVYCRNCFKNKGDTGPREFGRPSMHKATSNNITNEQFKILNSKLDKILDVLDSAQ